MKTTAKLAPPLPPPPLPFPFLHLAPRQGITIQNAKEELKEKGWGRISLILIYYKIILKQ